MDHLSRRLLLSSAASGLLSGGSADKRAGQRPWPGDVGTTERSSGRYIRNTVSDVPGFLEMFASDHHAEITLAEWIANTPSELVAAHLNIDPKVLASLPKAPGPVVPA